ncbi:hypothetical protein ACWCO0_13680 [Streptomyces tubercidicus]
MVHQADGAIGCLAQTPDLSPDRTAQDATDAPDPVRPGCDRGSVRHA